MKAFVVGGAVRDGLLGEPVNDRDWVVTGASPQDMLDAGYLPVGKDFPVFLHPDTHEEYALARTERKTGPGYRGFEVHAAPDVTLEDDLRRRDLTINAIAQQADGTLVDPYHGQRDLQAKVLRHVSEAFTEDPVRILRLARFAARWPEFTVAPETDALMKRMVEAGEVDSLVAERVWQELSRGLMERAPARMFEVLRGVGALARLIPEVDALFGVPQPPQHHPEIDTGVHTLMVLDRCAATAQPLPVRYACLVHDLGKGTTPADILPRKVIAAHYWATPSPQLMQHEWAKHGTCIAGATPDAYFDQSNRLFYGLRFPDMRRMSDAPLTESQFAQAFAAANPGLEPDSIRLDLDKQGSLQELWLCLDTSFRSMHCAAPTQPARIVHIRR